jgi:hypothetical protein
MDNLLGKSFFASLIVLVAVLGLPNKAIAEPLDYIQLTCSPELDYFAARTITLDLDMQTLNKLGKEKHSDQRIEERDGMHFIPGDIAKHPYKCKLPHHTVTLEISNYRPGHELGECATLDHFDMLVKIDGKEADEFSAFGVNRCTDPETHLIQLDTLGFTDCTIPHHGNSSTKVSCTTERVRNFPHEKR